MAATAGRGGEIKIELPTTDLGNPTTVGNVATLNSAVGTSLLGSLRGWSLEETVDTLDTTVMDNTATGFIFRDVIPSFKSWTASADFIYDPADTDVAFDAQFVAGNTVNIAIFPEGDDGMSSQVYGGKAMIVSISRSATYDGLIECSATFNGRDDLIAGVTAS